MSNSCRHDRGGRLSRRAFLGTTTAALAGLGVRLPGAENALPDDELARITAALPAKAWARPRQPRRLLIFERNVNYGGHPSIATATRAFRLMGEKTGAFSVTATKDPEVFRPESLRQFDAVFFNNNVGNLFTDGALRQSLADFIYRGGGLMGVHGTTVAFTQWPGAVEDWPEFGLMIGARGANHRASDERGVMKVEDPEHPLLAPFRGRPDFEYRDEFFRVHDPYSRRRLRVLLSLDNARLDPLGPSYGQLIRADQDYAVAWARQYGRGRSFYCTIAHNPCVFWDATMLSFYLAALQFILGDLAAPTTPSAFLTPAIRAQEKLGWRLGRGADADATLFEAIDAAASAGLLQMDALSTQKVSATMAQPFAPGLGDDERRHIRFKLDAAAVRLLTYQVPELPADPAACRALFDFARQMGCEAVIAPPPAKLDAAEQCARDARVPLALKVTGANPVAAAMKLCRGRSPQIGICLAAAQAGATATAIRKSVETLRERCLVLAISGASPAVREVLQSLRTAQLQPTVISLAPGPQLAALVNECQAAIEEIAR